VLGQGTGYAVATSTDTGTSGEQIALVASATTSGTPTAGYGPSLRFFRKGNDGGAAGSAASVRAVAIAGTGGSQYNSNLTLAARLAGNMVDVLTATGAGTVSIPSSTAGSSGAGALVVTGGLSAGNNGNASYFGGGINLTTSASGTSQLTIANTNGTGKAHVGSFGSSNYLSTNYFYGGSGHTTDDATLGSATIVLGVDRTLKFYSAAASATPSQSLMLTLDGATNAATFAGAVTIGNTVNTVSPTSPNRTITMVVNGVTLYLAAKTTND
jgi:hypothetical protein